MMKKLGNRYDFGFEALSLLLAYVTLAFARQQGWSWLASIVLLLLAAIPVGFALAWLKTRLKARRRKGGYAHRNRADKRG